MNILQSSQKLSSTFPNIASLLKTNTQRFSNRIVYQEKVKENYEGISWTDIYNDILNIAGNLKQLGFSKGDKMVFYSPNRKEMLELELAVMSIGGIAVPIYAWFSQETAELLIRHSEAKYLAVSGEYQLRNLSSNLGLNKIIVFDPIESYPGLGRLELFTHLLEERSDSSISLDIHASPDDNCLNMYTSGTMGIPKCVQLSHKNILSQQAGLDALGWWNINENDRFLSYLPWHHSFGGIFELFNALSHGATYSLESSYGKNVNSIIENWKIIQPTVFFSVPKIYQALFEILKENPEVEAQFFHPDLKFVFTAAATLPESLTKEFEKRNIPVIEGWGLTETSPCCTLTHPGIKRSKGIVGKPIPGVSIRISDDNEIQVMGPNVMKGYFKNDEANKNIFTEDGWFRTGDIGEITDEGIKLITRKDRIFKLSNGEKVIATEMEALIMAKCHYISFAIVSGSGEEYPVAILFPNKKLLQNPTYEISPVEGCFCPRNLAELGKCLHGCLHDANCGIGQKFSKIKSAIIIDDELSIENSTLTPSMKVAPNNVMNIYKAHLENLHGEKNELKEEVFIIRLDTAKTR